MPLNTDYAEGSRWRNDARGCKGAGAEAPVRVRRAVLD
eukprot:SAG11_NODE_2405_length_3397_cov_28.336162_1_plen_37_part_10